MAPLTIQLDGVSKTQWPAERCVLSITISSQDEFQANVSTEVKKTSNELQELFRQLSPKTDEGLPSPTAPVTIFSMTSLRTSTWIPKDRDGNPLAAVHEAATTFTITFRDFSKLAEVTSALFTKPFVGIDGTDWRLTDQTRERASTETRKAALRDAIRKADEYADVLGVNAVVSEITDHGSSSTGRTKQTARRAGKEMKWDGVEGLTIGPEEVEVSYSVAVKFVADWFLDCSGEVWKP
jgi:uncharacterized protein